MTHWQPSASIAHLKKRAEILSHIRDFFAKRNIVEVETPVLSPYCVTDIHMDPFVTQHYQHPYFLQSSPEYAMKRLLAGGSGPIYQICKCFRHESSGRLHNPEFTMLEWYLTHSNHYDLMTSISELLTEVFHWPQADTISFQALFESHLNINPITCSLSELHALTARHINLDNIDILNRDDLSQLLLTHLLEPQLGKQQPLFVYDYPTSQAALATIDHQQTPAVAQRFELYIQGIECANGFNELIDANEQYERFQKDQQCREEKQRDVPTIDPNFINALQSGLPPCAGVAMGIDRLMMLYCQSTSIKEVISFDWERA